MNTVKSMRAEFERISDATPEQVFVAVLIRDAAERATEGDVEAYEWLRRCSLRWWPSIVGEADCEVILDQLLQTVPEPVECRIDSTTLRYVPQYHPPSETAAFIQRLLPGLEA